MSYVQSMKAVDARGYVCEPDVVALAKSRILTSPKDIQYQILPNGINFYGNDRIVESRECHFLIYETINIETGKYYIGQHKTRNPKDDYLGSGKALKAAVKKHGVDKFIKIILMDLSSAAEMDRCEKALVTVDDCYPRNQKSYNIKEGGYDGAPSELTKQRQSILMKGRYVGDKNPVYGKKMKDLMGKEAFEEMQKKQKEHNGARRYWDMLRKDTIAYRERIEKAAASGKKRKGVKLTEEQKKNSILHNPWRGKHFFNNGIIEIRALECPLGYYPGRLRKFVEKLVAYSKKRSVDAAARKANVPKKNKIKAAKRIEQPKSRFGYRWWTNGNTEVKSRLCPGVGFSFGRLPLSEETRKKMSEHSGSKDMVERMKSENPEKYKEWSRKKEEGRIRYQREHAKEISDKRTQGHWWTNGEKNVFAPLPPEGFFPGMVVRKGKNRNVDNIIRRCIDWRLAHEKEV